MEVLLQKHLYVHPLHLFISLFFRFMFLKTVINFVIHFITEHIVSINIIFILVFIFILHFFSLFVYLFLILFTLMFNIHNFSFGLSHGVSRVYSHGFKNLECLILLNHHPFNLFLSQFYPSVSQNNLDGTKQSRQSIQQDSCVMGRLYMFITWLPLVLISRGYQSSLLESD